jgi:hypothetical protein
MDLDIASFRGFYERDRLTKPIMIGFEIGSITQSAVSLVQHNFSQVFLTEATVYVVFDNIFKSISAMRKDLPAGAELIESKSTKIVSTPVARLESLISQNDAERHHIIAGTAKVALAYAQLCGKRSSDWWHPMDKTLDKAWLKSLTEVETVPRGNWASVYAVSAFGTDLALV